MILLKQKAQVDAMDFHGHSGMHILSASEETHDNCVFRMMQALTNFKANLNIQSNDGSTPLHIAAFKNNHQTVKYLLELGASPSIFNKARQLPVDVATDTDI